tara:strand:+ start:753 stop:899 length:147 start_codon:yes stop_codon:yes gene_type:complete
LKDSNFRIKKYEIKIRDLENENIKLKKRIEILEKAIKSFRNAISDTLK